MVVVASVVEVVVVVVELLVVAGELEVVELVVVEELTGVGVVVVLGL